MQEIREAYRNGAPKTGVLKKDSITATLLLYFGTRAYLLTPDEGSLYVFSTRNNCCEFLAFQGVTFQSVTESYGRYFVTSISTIIDY